MTRRERRRFVRDHRTCIFGYGRKSDGPSMSVVYHAMDGDDILISTMAERGKAKAVRRSPKASLRRRCRGQTAQSRRNISFGEGERYAVAVLYLTAAGSGLTRSLFQYALHRFAPGGPICESATKKRT